MNPQMKAIREVHEFMISKQIPYMIIGGIALQYWGEPRFTRDIDVTILIPYEQERELLEKILSSFTPRISDTLEFALIHRICLVRSSEGYEIDMSLGIIGYEESAINRAINFDLCGLSVKICSAEDLIIHKAVAGRPQDEADIESIVIRQGKSLDVNYIRQWLREFSLLLGTEEALERFERFWSK
jgi:predicted nucleotidyltransferase